MKHLSREWMILCRCGVEVLIDPQTREPMMSCGCGSDVPIDPQQYKEWRDARTEARQQYEEWVDARLKEQHV